jgi:hypothetical protein
MHHKYAAGDLLGARRSAKHTFRASDLYNFALGSSHFSGDPAFREIAGIITLRRPYIRRTVKTTYV